MKTNISRLLAAIFVLGVLLSGRALSQEFKPLLGEAEPGLVKRTELGITVNANGFDRYRKNALRRGTRWLINDGHENLVAEFIDVAVTAPALLDQADDIYRQRVKTWTECGYTKAATLNPRRLTVTIEPVPFKEAGWNFPLAGFVIGDRVRVVVAVAGRTGVLQHYRNLMAWEFGNWIQCQVLGCARRIEDEIGHGSPCGRK